MRKDRIWEEIKDSADQVQVPEALLPENMEKKLEALKKEGLAGRAHAVDGAALAGGEASVSTDEASALAGEASVSADEASALAGEASVSADEASALTGEEAESAAARKGRRRARKYLPLFYGTAAAAVLFLSCYVMGRMGILSPKGGFTGEDITGTGEAADTAVVGLPEGSAIEEGAEDGAAASLPEEGNMADAVAAGLPEGSVGSPEADGPSETITVAKGEEVSLEAGDMSVEGIAWQEVKAPKQDAGDLYRVASDYEEVYDTIQKSVYFGYYSTADIDMIMKTNDVAAAAVQEAASVDGSATAVAEGQASGDGEAYSTTNLQVEGVDESDIVKTDGAYIYTVTQGKVLITDIRGEEMSLVGKIELSEGVVREMYVDGDRLVIVSSERQSSLEETGKASGGEAAYVEEEGLIDIDAPREYYRMTTKDVTTLSTYSIKDRANPSLEGRVSQDGAYMTSRKVGSLVYLFSRQFVWENCYEESETGLGWVPVIQGRMIPADHIYLPEAGGDSLFVSSINVEEPDQVVDDIMVVNNNAEVYVTSKSLYLYNTEYGGYEGDSTAVARFSLSRGSINAVAATNVSGYVRDVFAVNESGRSFRILTSGNSGNLGNCLYLYDLNLKQKGSLTGIAEDELIYAARYIGDMAYFVTYRNTDPLFAVDLSDEANPRLLGELQVTGYSDYLHFWEDGKLFGIGYETDPDTGSTKGIKIAMFDISDPADLKTIDTLVIKNANYTPALSQYKAVLADSGANLISFAVTDRYYGGEDMTCLVFEWSDGEFHNLLTKALDINISDYRGIYVGDDFYAASPELIVRFDRTDGYREVGRLALK